LTRRPLALELLEERFAVCRLPPTAGAPRWAESPPFFSLTRTTDELSIICPEPKVPADFGCDRGWQALKVQGPLDFGAVGVLQALLAPLAGAGVAVLAISTHDTDYLLVKEAALEAALSALKAQGCHLRAS